MAAPVFLALVVMAVIVLAIVLPGSPVRMSSQQFTIVGETIFMVLILCPMILCLIIPYALFVVAIFAIHKAHYGTSGVLRRVGDVVHTAAEKTKVTAEQVSKRSIGFNARFTFADHLLNVFERPKSETSELEGRTSDD